MIYLQPEVVSGLGDDTFWTWMKREFPRASFSLPARLGDKDVVLQYSTLGPCLVPGGKKVALLWELHPEMVTRGVPGDWSKPMKKIADCARQSDFRVVSSHLMSRFYHDYGPLRVVPIGVDTTLFRPRPDEKRSIRQEFGLPLDGPIYFWGGTNHPMKGFDLVERLLEKNPKMKVVVVWKSKRESRPLRGHPNFVKLPQPILAKLMAACDYVLVSGMLSPYFMIEWEAMAAGLKPVNLRGLQKDFDVGEEDPRKKVILEGWSREQAKQLWINYLTNYVGAEL